MKSLWKLPEPWTPRPRPPLLGKLQNSFPRAPTGVLGVSFRRGHFYRGKDGDARENEGAIRGAQCYATNQPRVCQALPLISRQGPRLVGSFSCHASRGWDRQAGQRVQHSRNESYSGPMIERAGAAILPFEGEEAIGFEESLRRFRWGDASTATGQFDAPADAGERVRVNTFTNEFWTAKQRAAHSLHEISYRACFKPQLPRFFVERLSQPGDIVYDPFMGRGTTLVEAALMGRRPCGCDVNPLSGVLCGPRLRPPSLLQVQQALAGVDFRDAGEMPEELLVFYHADTLRQISALRKYLLGRERTGVLTSVDRWIRMVAVNRLTGHSAGFFSVYTLPPNQAVSPRAQAKINSRLNQRPSPRDVPAIILSKSRSLLRDVTPELRKRLDDLAGSARSSSAHPPQRLRSRTTRSRWPSRRRHFSMSWITRATTGCGAGSAESTLPPSPSPSPGRLTRGRHSSRAPSRS